MWDEPVKAKKEKKQRENQKLFNRGQDGFSKDSVDRIERLAEQGDFEDAFKELLNVLSDHY